MGRLEGKVAFVTGAGGGIGSAICRRFLEEGARVVAADIAEPQAAASVAAAGPAQALPTRCDVTDPLSVQEAMAAAVRAFGAIHVLCNVAGGSTKQDGAVTDVPDEAFWQVLKLNLFGTFLSCKYGLKEIIRAGGGSVINFASLLAVLPKPGRSSYIASKGGIIALTHAMAADYAEHGVRVNAIAPGRTVTARTRHLVGAGDGLSDKIGSRHLLGLIDPIDVAHTAVYLASDESRKVTGQTLFVDSGARVG